MAIKSGGKKGRIVVRNLSYKATEDDIIEYFKPFGEIKDHNILKFENGKIKGVAFIEYNKMFSALKAIKERNMKEFMGRIVAVDMAVSKQRFSSIKNSDNIENKNVKVECKIEESVDQGSSDLIPPDKIKKEDFDMENTDTGQIMMEKEEIKEECIESNINYGDDCDVDGEDDEDEGEDDDDYDNEDESEDDDDEIDYEDDYDENSDSDGNNAKGKNKRLKKDENFKYSSVSKDVQEGRTIFIRNISFQSSEEEIEEMLSQFGSLKYVVFCRDSETGRFRGTAFAQFIETSSCAKCLEAFIDPVYKDKFIVGGRTLFLIPAVGRDEVSKQKEERKAEKEKKDKRNLYLAREGVIRPGTKPAIGVSKGDLSLRIVRENVKRKMLSNFNIFVSPIRLFICNLPLELNDTKLKDIFIKHSPKGSVIKECRIMRDLFSFDDENRPVSKGHGFVTFSEHAHALEALRNVNNNPDIFTKNKRPVVEFSLENVAALKAREARLKKSKENNFVKGGKNLGLNNVPLSSTTSNEFMGSKYDPAKKGLKAFHSHIGPKIRHRDRNSKSSNKISRSKINNNMKNSEMSKRWKKKIEKSNKKSTSKKGNKNKNTSNTKRDKPKNKTKKKKTFI